MKLWDTITDIEINDNGTIKAIKGKFKVRDLRVNI